METTTTEEYTGWKRWYPTDEEISEFFVSGTCPVKLLENEYLIINDGDGGEMRLIYRKVNGKLEKVNRAAIKINDPKDGRTKKVFLPRNPEQVCAFDLLHDDQTTVKLISGKKGSGKTLILVTAGLEALHAKRFEKIIWIRNSIDVKDTKDMGALPGTLYEKAEPFLGPFIDHVGDKMKVAKMVEMGQLEIIPLQFLRGRDIQNSIIMCSEAENLTLQHLALIISRAAEGSIVVFDGDVVQRDKAIFEKSKGMETMIKKLAGNKLFGYVHLIKTERSATAALAEELE